MSEHPQEPSENPTDPAPMDNTPEDNPRWPTEPDSPGQRISHIREKMEQVANEYAAREISRAQFNAIYAHYNEQRLLIEEIIARNPTSDGWKQAARSGKTSFLREHYNACPLNYVVFLHQHKRPIVGGGTRPDMARINNLLRSLWNVEKIRVGVARIELKGPEWIVMTAGYYSVTLVTFHLEPSGGQVNYVRDLHNDFERANRLFLKRRKINKAQMVFPQRALLEQTDF